MKVKVRIALVARLFAARCVSKMYGPHSHVHLLLITCIDTLCQCLFSRTPHADILILQPFW